MFSKRRKMKRKIERSRDVRFCEQQNFQIASNCLELPQIASNCLKLPQIASNCLKLPQIASNCLKLPQISSLRIQNFLTKFLIPTFRNKKLHEIAQNCPKLPKIASNWMKLNCFKLPQIAPNCPKLPQIAPNCLKLLQNLNEIPRNSTISHINFNKL